MLFIGKQGWHSGKRTHLPPLWRAAQIPALNPSVSLLLVLSFAPRGFLQVFLFSHSNLTRNQADGEPLSGCATSLNLLFIIIICYFSFFLLFL